MKLLSCTISLLIVSCIAYGQAILSGVINQYAAVTELDVCANTLNLSDASGFLAGMSVLIMQMQGAEINTSNNSGFGDIANLRNTGRYERARIAAVNGNTITLEATILNNYDLDGRVQVISLPVYQDAIVRGTLEAAPWNGQTGGVLVLEVSGNLILEGDLIADAKGFRGGRAGIAQANNCNFILTHFSYFYELGNWRGAAKGEGVAIFTTGREAGRGPQANGGGGGNDHNAGGGGGANPRRGGRGGNNNEPNALGCNGLFPGLGGQPLPIDTTRLFLGGGGGAGHDNNLNSTDGGAGGGIVILLANNIISNNHLLSANGGSVSAVTNGDGAGGGGGGGTILLHANSVSGTLRLQANGGDGGNVNNGGQARCHGPGGGGSGGRVLAPENPMLFISNDGGTAGTSNNSATCANGNNGALPGEAGIRAFPNVIPQSTQQNEPPAIVAQPRMLQPCPNTMLTIPVVAQGANLSFQWQINTGGGFQNIQNNAIYNGVQTPELQISNTSAVPVDAQFRLRASNNCGETIFSDLITLALQPAPVAQFDFIVTGTTVQFFNRSVAADMYRWDFGDGNDANAADPTHIYNNTGAFTVTLTAFGACDTVSFSQVVTIVAAPLADFTANVVTGCAPLSVVFENLSSPDAVSFAWILPGATPAFSTARNPTVVYNTPGSYAVTLIASNAIGLDTLMRTAFITVRAAPTAGFLASTNGLTVTFLNMSSADADSYLWSFGDESTSSEEHPTHTYTIPGIYVVTLTATNACGSRSFTLEIAAGIAPLASFSQNFRNGCAPHLVTFQNTSTGVFDSQNWTFPGGEPASSNEPNPVVTYVNPGQYDVVLSISGPLGSSTLRQERYIRVLPPPISDFDFTINGNQVAFTNLATDATTLFWNFGDGNTSMTLNPTHTYATAGVYTVTLNASNAFCGRAVSKLVVVGLNAAEFLQQAGIQVFPNPTSDWVYVHLAAPAPNWHYRLFNTSGQLLQTSVLQMITAIDLSAQAKGLYLLQLQSPTTTWSLRIIKW